MSVGVMIITKGATQVSFIGAPQWTSLYLSKSTRVCGTPKLVEMTGDLSGL